MVLEDVGLVVAANCAFRAHLLCLDELSFVFIEDKDLAIILGLKFVVFGHVVKDVLLTVYWRLPEDVCQHVAAELRLR